MCGIAGLIAQRAINAQALQRMTDLMAHRGPDGEGHWFNEDQTVGLGHRRLSIIDLSELGNQPMTDHSSQYVLTFNGEIYNYLELKQELSALGSRFRSGSDSEVILEAYKYWGSDCVQHFNGMFGFALYDSAAQTVFCARDRYGEKPFLYSDQPTFFAFASEYKALLSLLEMPMAYDEQKLALNAVVAGKGLDDQQQTVFTAIHQLLPAQALILNVATLSSRVWTYWQITPNEDYARLSALDATSLFRNLLTDSIRLRLRSDVPVGSCLSGGLDSSAIVSIVKKQLLPNQPYHTFTGTFPNTKADEWPFAEVVIKDTDVISHRTAPSSQHLASELAEFVWLNELPVSSTSQYAQWCVFKLAKAHNITVLLDGQGADELLGGYEQYFRLYLSSLREAGQTAFSQTEEVAIRERYPLALGSSKQQLAQLIPFGAKHYYANTLNKGTNLLYGMPRRLASTFTNEAAFTPIPGFSPLTAALRQESFGRFLTTLLRYGDRNSMAHSREVRLPFCDYRLAELVLSLPPTYLMGEVQTKRLLRESTRGILHETIRTRWNKQGFRPPQEQWFSGTLMDIAEDLFNQPSFSQNPHWDSAWWQTALQRIKRGETGLSWAVWPVFSILAWKQHFVNNPTFEHRCSVFA